MNEFELIRRYFTRPAGSAVLGVGDDCALINVSPGHELAISTDMLVAGRHFLADTDPYQLGHKTLAVNLSDIAAMGGTPRWATLALALPEADPLWLERFSAGFFALAERFGVDLVGGDTTRGPLNLCVTIFGEVPAGQALRRSGARVGDDIWVSGVLGQAALALAQTQRRTRLQPGEVAQCEAALHTPEPRVALGQRLLGLANSAIDISDGFVGDLGHILEASKTGAIVQLAALPCSTALRARLSDAEHELALHCLLGGGDDYELCFTAPVARREQVQAVARALALPLSRVGTVEREVGLRIRDERGDALVFSGHSFDHFAS